MNAGVSSPSGLRIFTFNLIIEGRMAREVKIKNGEHSNSN